MLGAIARTIKILLLVAAVGLFIAFAIDNRDVTSVSLFPLPYAADLPKFLLVMLCFALGIIIGGLTVGIHYVRARRLFREEHRRAMALQDELRHVQTEQDSKLPAVPGR